MHLVEWDIAFTPVDGNAARHLRRQIKQGTDGRICPSTRFQFQYLAEQNKNGNGRRRFEIDVRGSPMSAEACRKYMREERCDHAVHIRNAHAKTDQREHVRAAVLDRRPEAVKERPSAPEDNRGRQREATPRHQPRRRGVLPTRNQVDEHAAYHEWSGEDQADPESARHVAQFGILDLDGDGPRLQSHPANGTAAGRVAHDLGMHGAGPLGLGRSDRCFRFERHAALGASSGMILTDLRIHRADVSNTLRSRGRLRFRV